MVCALQLPVVLQSKVLRQHVYHIYTYTCMYTYIAGSAICIFQMMYLHFLCVEDPLEIQGDFERTFSPNIISDTPVESHHTSLNRKTGNKLYLTIYLCVLLMISYVLNHFYCFFCIVYIYIFYFSHNYIPSRERSHIPHRKAILRRLFSELPFRWDMLIPWRVFV